MRLFYQHAIDALWLGWATYWCAAAFSAKATRRQESVISRLLHLVPFTAGVALFLFPSFCGRLLTARFLPFAPVWFFLGLILVIAGLAISVSARVLLGGNWSGTVTLKQDHELVRRGPYRWVRHPIYTGLLVALLGSAAAIGEWRGLLGMALITLSLSRKITVEERFLTDQFGEAYKLYQREVPALVPGWR